MIDTPRMSWLIIAFLMAAGCGKPVASHPDASEMKSNAALNSLAQKLLDEKDARKQVAIRREIYRLGKPGIDFLVDGVANPKFHSKIVSSSSPADSFHIEWRNGPRFYFVDVRDGKTTDLTDLTKATDARLLSDDKYLDQFVARWWNGGSGIPMEGCVDELTDNDSTAASRRIAHRLLRDYKKLNLAYDPTLPVSKMPPDIRKKLAKWKTDHYEGSSWQSMDEFDAEMNPPPLNITAADVPEPKHIPFKDEKDRAAYIEFYKRAYLIAANMQGYVGMSCCLGKTPNRTAKIDGHYAGFEDANNAKVEAVKREFEKKKQKQKR